ncbi:Serine protease 2 [Pseudolycoriella hygida]|uniref:Serine protease 2 n=1 Tax=Pseudolycoriella hygida TaxID=35572 RepID=A0A9Q0RWL5_9DIPT|nr:Serine protease 2 [Pseudolycoriella hygida]
MKLFVVLCAIIAHGLAASLPNVQITTFRESVRASAYNSLSAKAPLVGRIANGQPANENQIPYQVAVLSPIGHVFSICGGSIISTGWVLTAAHCTDGYSQHNLRFGTITSTIGGQVQTAFESIIHPEYNRDNKNFDISIIPIPTPLVLTAAIQVIRLPTNRQISSTFADVSAVVSGWGSTYNGGGASQILNWAEMRVIRNSECADFFGNTVVVDHVLCAVGSGGPTQGHCGGDSGGPLTIVEAGVRTQIGVVSFGAAAGCNNPYPSGYMRTSNFIHWINEKTSIPIRP